MDIGLKISQEEHGLSCYYQRETKQIQSSPAPPLKPSPLPTMRLPLALAEARQRKPVFTHRCSAVQSPQDTRDKDWDSVLRGGVESGRRRVWASHRGHLKKEVQKNKIKRKLREEDKRRLVTQSWGNKGARK